MEAADTTVAFDREEKAPLYALAGIGEYWLVDLAADQIEVFRAPSLKGYRDVHRFVHSHTLRPTAFSDLELPVDAILPSPRSPKS